MRTAETERSAGRAAGEVELGGQNGVLAGQNIVGEDFLLHILEAQALDGVGEAFAGLALLAEEEDGLFDSVQDLFLAGKELAEGLAVGNLLAPAAADVDLEAGLALFNGVEGAVADAAAAVVADLGVDFQHAVLDLAGLHGADVDDLALLAAVAAVLVELGHQLGR